MSNFQFIATTPKGMEPFLLQEIQELKAFGATQIKAVKAGVTFEGPLEVGYRACLWSRTASRILLALKTFSCESPDQLYAGVRKIHWTDHLTPNHTMAVDFSASRSKISHSHYGALKAKDAIVDQLKTVKGSRPNIATKQPDVQVNIYLNDNKATVSIDLSGDSLHMRGYRDELTPAPMKENLAAALLLSAGLKKDIDSAEDFTLLDPMCGSGTMPIEAALIVGDIAPGIARKYFGFLKWLGHEEATWTRLLEEAKERNRFKSATKMTPAASKEAGTARFLRKVHRFPKIIGTDADFRAIRTALSNLEKAGPEAGSLRGKVHFEKKAIADAVPVTARGIFIVNPPYGERIGDEEKLKVLYESIGDLMKQKFKGWNGCVFTGNPNLAKVIGLKADEKVPFYNGPIECRLLKYNLY